MGLEGTCSDYASFLGSILCLVSCVLWNVIIFLGVNVLLVYCNSIIFLGVTIFPPFSFLGYTYICWCEHVMQLVLMAFFIHPSLKRKTQMYEGSNLFSN